MSKQSPTCEMCGNEVGGSGRKRFRYADGWHTYCYPCRTTRSKKRETEDNRKRNIGNNLKRRLIKQRGRRCEKCGAFPKQIHGHHIIPLRKGGQNTPENMLLLCAECHTLEHPNGTRYE